MQAGLVGEAVLRKGGQVGPAGPGAGGVPGVDEGVLVALLGEELTLRRSESVLMMRMNIQLWLSVVKQLSD